MEGDEDLKSIDDVEKSLDEFDQKRKSFLKRNPYLIWIVMSVGSVTSAVLYVIGYPLALFGLVIFLPDIEDITSLLRTVRLS